MSDVLDKISEESGVMPKPGDVIWVDRGAYQHCGIYEGAGQVIHFAAAEGSEICEENAVIHPIALDDFTRGNPLKIVKFDKGFSPEETVARARKRIGERGYNFITNNCDHFATWCKTGKNYSVQVEDAKFRLGMIAEALVGDSEEGKALVGAIEDIVCTAHDIVRDFKPQTLENSGGSQAKIETGRALADAVELNSAISENYTPMEDDTIAEEMPPDEMADDAEYLDLPKYEDEEESEGEDAGDDAEADVESDGSGGSKLSKIDLVTDKLKGMVYAVSGVLELFKPHLPPALRNVPFKAIGAKVANVIDKIGIAIKVFAKILTPMEGKAAMQNADTALLGQTVREKSAVPVGERIQAVFGKVGAAIKQVVHTAVDHFAPRPLRQAIKAGFQKVGTVIASGIGRAAQKAVGFFSKIKTAVFG